MSNGKTIERAGLEPIRQPLKQLGEYTVIAELARGGMGKVYLARRSGEAGFERLYALKVMHEHMLDDPEAVLMLLDEAKIAARLHHPNVVPISDIGSYDGGYFLVMEYVEGASFYQVLARNRMTRHARLIVPVMIDALRGLHAAHELRDEDGGPLDLVHRDFSPHNLLVGTDGICRVTDFGVAKAKARFTHTETRMQKGKLAYMAPEQLAAEDDIDRRVDIWAAGVVLTYALSGQHPFKGSSEAATIRNIVEKVPGRPSEAGLRPPACLDEVCMRALERDREDRFESAEAMANELQKIAVRHDLLAPPSQVGAWVMASFRYELEARRRTIRAVRGDGVTFISLPVMPHMTVTPSTGGHELSSSCVHLEIDTNCVPVPELGRELPAASPPPAQPGAAPELVERAAAERADRTAPTRAARTRERAPERPAAPAPPRPAPPPEASPQAPRPRRQWSLFVGGLAAAGALAFGAFLVGRQSTAPSSGPAGPAPTVEPAPRAEATEAEPASEPRPAAARPAAAAPASEAPTAPGSEASVQVSLRGLPEGATVRLDGLVLTGPVAVVPRDGLEHVIQVEAPGLRPWSRAFVPAQDLDLEVSMQRAGERRPGAKGPPRRPAGPSIVRDPGF